MPDIKLRDGSGVETTYNNVDTITVPLADGSGTWKYSSGDFYNEDTFVLQGDNYPSSQKALANILSRELSRQGATLSMSGSQRNIFGSVTDDDIDLSTIDINITNGST